MYFVISNCKGETTVESLNKEQLTTGLNNKAWGDNVVFMDKIPEFDTNYWSGGAVLIIKGDIIVPRPVEYVIKLEVD